MSNEQYIGKPLSECPDGTVAITSFGNCDLCVSMRTGDTFASVQPDLKTIVCQHDLLAAGKTVHGVLRLGQERPKTMADLPSGEAWDDGTGRIHWRGDDQEVLYLASVGTPVHDPMDADQIKVTARWFCVGRIVGVRYE